MDKENKEKLKKKKVIKREEIEINDNKSEGKNPEVPQRVTEMQENVRTCQTGTEIIPAEKESLPPVGSRSKAPDTVRDRERRTPEGFYIAHPKNIKRIAHFKDVHSRKLSELLEAFHMFDFDRDGVINHEDLRKTFASLCIESTDEEIEQMLSEGLNPLNFDAFVILLGYKTLDLDPEEVLLDALSNWDDHQEGLVSYESLVAMTMPTAVEVDETLAVKYNMTPCYNPVLLMQHIMAWGDRFTEEEAIAALADAPIVLNKTKERMIDYIQFSEDLCGLRKMMQRKTSKGGN